MKIAIANILVDEGYIAKYDLVEDGVVKTLHGRATARKIGEQAGAKIVIGRRVLYSIEKVKKYLLYLEE